MIDSQGYNRCLVMFVRFPASGQVKSRLAQKMGEEIVVNLYRCFIEDLLERLAHGAYQFRIAFYPEEKEHEIREKYGDEFIFMPQHGEELGERMRNSFIRCFSEGFRSVVVIGSDSPDLPLRIIEEAFSALENNDAVLGPSADGGYYLIGFRRETFNSHVFGGIPWGSETVFQETMNIFHTDGALVHVLPVWLDIDRPEDIAILLRNSENEGFAKSRTISYLREKGFA